MYFKFKIAGVIVALFFLSFTSLSQQKHNIQLSNNPYDDFNSSIAVNPYNTKILLSAWDHHISNGCERIAFSFSTDNGMHWSIETVMEPPVITYYHPPDEYWLGQASVAFDRHGNAFCGYRTIWDSSDGNTAYRNIFVSVTNNFGPNPDWCSKSIPYV